MTLGGTIVDRECQLRLNARTLAVLGYTAAARETMCLDDNVRQAMLAAGTPCAADRGVYAPAATIRLRAKCCARARQYGRSTEFQGCC